MRGEGPASDAWSPSEEPPRARGGDPLLDEIRAMRSDQKRQRFVAWFIALCVLLTALSTIVIVYAGRKSDVTSAVGRFDAFMASPVAYALSPEAKQDLEVTMRNARFVTDQLALAMTPSDPSAGPLGASLQKLVNATLYELWSDVALSGAARGRIEEFLDRAEQISDRMALLLGVPVNPTAPPPPP